MTLLSSLDSGLLTLTLNRPEKRNALSTPCSTRWPPNWSGPTSMAP